MCSKLNKTQMCQQQDEDFQYQRQNEVNLFASFQNQETYDIKKLRRHDLNEFLAVAPIVTLVRMLIGFMVNPGALGIPNSLLLSTATMSNAFLRESTSLDAHHGVGTCCNDQQVPPGVIKYGLLESPPFSSMCFFPSANLHLFQEFSSTCHN